MKLKVLSSVLLLLILSTNVSAQTKWIGDFLKQYRPPVVDPAARVTPPVTDNPWRLMVRADQLPLAVSDVIRLMLQSNLDVTVSRFSPLIDQYQLQSLFRPFEPTLDITALMVRSTEPTASQLTAGADVRVFSQLFHQYTVGYGQTMQTGTRVDVDFSVRRSSNNDLFRTFNPSYRSDITYRVSQPLWRNFGRDINTRMIRIARNNLNVSEVDFEIQMIGLVTQAQQLYWDLVYQLEDIKVRKNSLELAQKTLSDNKRQVQIGTMAPIDVVQAEAAVAQREEQMATTTFIADQTQDRVKRMITNLGDPALVLAQLSPLDQPRKPSPNDVLPLADAIKYALESRPELKRLDLQLRNSDIELQYQKNQLRPDLSIGASYTQSGVGGVQTNRDRTTGQIQSVVPGGIFDAFGQVLRHNFTGYTVGFNLSIPLSNKSVQADYARTLTSKQAIQAARNQLTQQIALEVRNATSQVEMNRARITAAERALQLANLQLEAEQKKFQLGTSQLRFVLQEQQSVTAAQTSQIQALVNYTKALVEYDRTLGRTLRQNNVEIDKQLEIAGLYNE